MKTIKILLGTQPFDSFPLIEKWRYTTCMNQGIEDPATCEALAFRQNRWEMSSPSQLQYAFHRPRVSIGKMSLKGDLDAVTSFIRKSKDPVLLDHAMSLQHQVLQLIERIHELEKEHESIQDLLKKYKKNT